MVEEWRFLDTGLHDAFYNMALDEAIMTARSKNLIPNTIRFFRWRPSAVSIGYFQSMKDEVDIAACNERGIDYVRRITGGGTVYHDEEGELTYSITVAENHRLASKDFQKTYQVLCSGLVQGLNLLGIPAKFKQVNDIIVDGEKISGNAQTRKRGVILQHGTILRRVNPPLMFTLLKVPSEKIRGKLIKTVNERVTSIERYLGREVSFEELKKALRNGFEKAFKIRLIEGQLIDFENSLTSELIVKKYSSKSWNFRR
ncbi:lipoate--protein ligase family protein [Candidatus Bathyarchaeota archaeon]|nr:MAG: lipoate--protein ligase family protein [Candidatus Bathyarchaeota archaeon]